MTAEDFQRFHELAEQLRGEMSVKGICQREGVPYRSYLQWRKTNGLAPQRSTAVVPSGLVEVEPVGLVRKSPAMAGCKVRIDFGDGLLLRRDGMPLGSLIDVLTKISAALCSD